MLTKLKLVSFSFVKKYIKLKMFSHCKTEQFELKLLGVTFNKVKGFTTGCSKKPATRDDAVIFLQKINRRQIATEQVSEQKKMLHRPPTKTLRWNVCYKTNTLTNC